MQLTWRPLLILEVFAVYCRTRTIVEKSCVNRGYTTLGRRRYKFCNAKIADLISPSKFLHVLPFNTSDAPYESYSPLST
ncbi:hypothetical protein JOM56_006800, partial [Amanita muscaria]